MKIELDEKAVRHLERVLNYLQCEETQFNENCKPRNRIWRHVRALEKVLKATPPVFPRGWHNQPA